MFSEIKLFFKFKQHETYINDLKREINDIKFQCVMNWEDFNLKFKNLENEVYMNNVVNSDPNNSDNLYENNYLPHVINSSINTTDGSTNFASVSIEGKDGQLNKLRQPSDKFNLSGSQIFIPPVENVKTVIDQNLMTKSGIGSKNVSDSLTVSNVSGKVVPKSPGPIIEKTVCKCTDSIFQGILCCNCGGVCKYERNDSVDNFEKRETIFIEKQDIIVGSNRIITTAQVHRNWGVGNINKPVTQENISKKYPGKMKANETVKPIETNIDYACPSDSQERSLSGSIIVRPPAIMDKTLKIEKLEKFNSQGETEEFSKTVRFSPIVPSKNTELPFISSVHEKCEEIGHIRDKLRKKNRTFEERIHTTG